MSNISSLLNDLYRIYSFFYCNLLKHYLDKILHFCFRNATFNENQNLLIVVNLLWGVNYKYISQFCQSDSICNIHVKLYLKQDSFVKESHAEVINCS